MIIEQDHPAFINPNENEIIWRYLSLDRFKSLLEYKSLFFCRADKFTDSFEGSITTEEANFRIIFQERVSNFYGENFNKEQAEINIDGLREMHKKMKGAVTINCWHINNNESDSMWQLYAKTNKGIAIKTSVKRMIKSIEKSPEEIFISKVRYIDFENDIWYNEKEYPCRAYNFYTPFVHKRIEFKHESELRLIHHIKEAESDSQFWLKQKFEEGIMIFAELDILIDKIVIPKTASKYFENRVINLLKTNQLNKEIIRSKLASDPIY